MGKNLFLILTLCGALLVGYVIISAYQYTKFSYVFPSSFNSKQQLHWYMPELIDWRVSQGSGDYQTTNLDYVLDHALQEFQGGYDEMTVTIARATRVTPFSIDELEETETLSRGSIRYSKPALSKDGNYATSLFTVRNLDGFFTIRAPVNFPAQCSPRDTQAIVASVLTSISSDSKPLRSDLLHSLKVWQTMRSLNWPQTTSSCF